MRMGRDAGTDEERFLYYKFKNKRYKVLIKGKILKFRFNYRVFKTVKVYIMFVA